MAIDFCARPVVHADGSPVAAADLLEGHAFELRQVGEVYHLSRTCTCPVCEAWRNDAVRPPNETAPKL